MSNPADPIPRRDPAVAGESGELNLKEVAARLGLHYSTVYRYLRHGRLVGERRGSSWFVAASEVAAFEAESSGRSRPAPSSARQVDWTARLVGCLCRGDEAAAWRVVRAAQAARHDFTSVHLDVVVGALARVSAAVAEGTATAAEERSAAVVAWRLVARLGGEIRRPGRRRGTVVLATPSGEHHGLALAVVANLLRHAGFGVRELGTDCGADDLVDAVGETPQVIAVGLGISSVARIEETRRLIEAVRVAHPAVPVLLGGQAVRNAEVAALAGAGGWSAGPDLVEQLTRLVAGHGFSVPGERLLDKGSRPDRPSTRQAPQGAVHA